MKRSSYQLDHVVILVNDLDTATRDYSALGFTVVQGGEHSGLKTHNALIAFADDSYLELVAFKDLPIRPVSEKSKSQGIEESSASKNSLVERRVLRWETLGEGFVDFALLPEDIEVNIEATRRRGLMMEDPLPGGRLRPDGQQVAWQFGIPDAFDLPFLCADVTPRSLRVPVGIARRHPNGVAGIVGIAVAVKDLDSSIFRYRALLGVESLKGNSSLLPETRTADFVLFSATITLAAPSGKSSPLRKHLDIHGEGPYAVKLRTVDKSRIGILEPSLSHESRIELVCY